MSHSNNLDLAVFPMMSKRHCQFNYVDVLKSVGPSRGNLAHSQRSVGKLAFCGDCTRVYCGILACYKGHREW